MSRAYTAWVIQNGKGEQSKFFGLVRDPHFGNEWGWHKNQAKALQFARRSDARNFIDAEAIEDEGRPVEKVFG